MRKRLIENTWSASRTSNTIPACGKRYMEVSIADTFFLRLRGLLGRQVEELGGLLITPCNQIHTCFMTYPIDVVYLDEKHEAICVERDVSPWKLCKAVKGAAAVLELPAGSIS